MLGVAAQPREGGSGALGGGTPQQRPWLTAAPNQRQPRASQRLPLSPPTRQGRYRCEKGTTGVLNEKVTLLALDVADETVQTMDTS